MHENTFLIYQLKEGRRSLDFRYESLEHLKAAGLAVERGKYNHVYTGMLEPGKAPALETLDALYVKFNMAHPEDFPGRSLSTSDIVVLCRDGKRTAHYVDSIGFKQVPEFLEGPYRYYSTQRPIDIGTFPKTENGPVQITNFNKRERVENATFRAWGYLAYDAPLTQKQIDDYELQAASDNPDHVKLSPYQLEAQAQAQAVGKWEKSKRIPDVKRLTWWYSDFGVFVKKEYVPNEWLVERFGQVMESKARAAQERAAKKPITDQLKEAERQVARGDMPPVKKKSHNHEDR